MRFGMFVLAFGAAMGLTPLAHAGGFADLAFTSNVENTRVIANYGVFDQEASCVAPCSLKLPEGRPFQIRFYPPEPGYKLAQPLPEMAWKCRFLSGCALPINAVEIVLEREH